LTKAIFAGSAWCDNAATRGAVASETALLALTGSAIRCDFSLVRYDEQELR